MFKKNVEVTIEAYTKEDLLKEAHDLYHCQAKIKILEDRMERNEGISLCDTYTNVSIFKLSSQDVQALLSVMQKQYEEDLRSFMDKTSCLILGDF